MRFNPDEYVSVAERIAAFYERFPQGRILTSAVEHDRETGFVLMRAEVYREPADELPAATGHAYELKSAGHVQAGSYVEVCETSAVGRALALLGFEVRRGVTSREEVVKGQQKAQGPRSVSDSERSLIEQIREAAEALGYDDVKVRKWVNQKYEVTTGLDGLTDADKRAVLKLFLEQAPRMKRA